MGVSLKRPIKSIPRPSAIAADYEPPKLSVIEGNGETQDATMTAIESARLRELLVKRARGRVEAGYYQRPDVVRRLVDVLWDEFYSR